MSRRVIPGSFPQEFIQSKLEMAYRTNLTKHVMGQYLGDEADGEGKGVFYKLGTLLSLCVRKPHCHYRGSGSSSAPPWLVRQPRRPDQEPGSDDRR